MKRILGLFLGLGLVGCAHATYNRLSPDAQDDWRRCYGKIIEAQCAVHVDTFGITLCSNNLLNDYAKSRATKKWLIRHGCPSEMVN
jgi:hypothetical protein